MKKILIIDNNQSSLELEHFLRTKDYSPIIADTVDEGLENIKESENLKVVLLNVELSGISGLDALKKIKHKHPEVIVIVIKAGVNTARKATRLGAMDVLSKRFDMEHIHRVLGRAFGRLSIRNQTSPLPQGEMPKEPYALVGESDAMFELNKAIGRVAHNKVSVLIEGETGTGKELVARLIHKESERAAEPFISVDCGAVPDGLRESELFGYEKGAFTDARSDGKPGQFELADGGTLFLDEVSNMTPALQETLLNVLQTGQVLRVGGTQPYNVDVRVVSATNRKLREMVAEGKFREDLYYRLCGYRISLPSLRERIEDIPLLVAYFLQRIEGENGKPIFGVAEKVMKLFQGYNWPGNVRELENCLKNAAVNSQGEPILPNDLPQALRMSRASARFERNIAAIHSSETLTVAPGYRNLFDLSVIVFCKFISDGQSGITDSQINEWWVEFSNDGRDRANQAKREIDNWWVEWHTTGLTFPDLSGRIKKVIDDGVSQLSNLRHRMDSTPIAEADPISIEGRTLKGSLTAVLHEIVKAHRGDREKAASELDIPVQQLERRLSYIVKEYEGDREKAAEVLDIPVQQLAAWLSDWTGEDKDEKKNSLRTPIKPSRQLERFPDEEIRKLLTESVISFASESFSPLEWADKSLNAQIRTVHLALKAASRRLAGGHGYIYFGGMTLSQIERGIYRRAPYLYTTPAEAAEALNVDMRTFRQYWPKHKVFPSHYTLFTG